MTDQRYQPSEGANTRIEYLYRDGDNYKKGNAVILEGRIEAADAQRMLSTLNDGEHFLPGQVGLEDMTGKFEHGGGWDDDSDHPWHELELITHTDAEPSGTLADLLAKWPNSVVDWRPAEAEARIREALQFGNAPKP